MVHNRDTELLLMIEEVLGARSEPKGYVELFLGNTQDPSVMFVGINPGTTGTLPRVELGAATNAMREYRGYFIGSVNKTAEDRNIWKYYRRFGNGQQRGFEWIRDIGACISNLVPWASHRALDLGTYRSFKKRADVHWPRFCRLVGIVRPGNLVFHSEWVFNYVRDRIPIRGRYADVVNGPHPVISWRELCPTGADIPVAFAKHLSRCAPNTALVNLVNGTLPEKCKRQILSS